MLSSCSPHKSCPSCGQPTKETFSKKKFTAKKIVGTGRIRPTRLTTATGGCNRCQNEQEVVTNTGNMRARAFTIQGVSIMTHHRAGPLHAFKYCILQQKQEPLQCQDVQCFDGSS